MVCYTIGHSTRSLEDLIYIIKRYKINCIMDIRRVSYAPNKYTKIFNREFLDIKLREEEINYIYSGKELGGIIKEKWIINEEGAVDFDKIIINLLFQKGIEKVRIEIENGQKIALLCSERNPLNCHRSILIGYALSKCGIFVEHIIDENNTKSQSRIEEELFITYEPRLKSKLVNISLQDILDSENYDDISAKEVKRKIIEQGYRMKWKEINKNFI
ncbi:DUF488 domain-containing protein [Clostridium sp. ZS2-4]|uniref:DUF488 domain-containing protein n=1 Tax=Clostridium sp. ZS2-4 TaxID=2987703 RepID=UPI00227B147F|nr:DUF488 domain-containing protein [Clostridium sp. ZS2-4]MCY6355592.1 DUF488 domain-containing protein [Clostridium sp. ZS2-4]